MPDEVSLPKEKAYEPDEAARQPLVNGIMTPLNEQNSPKRHCNVTFVGNTESVATSASQKSSISYKEFLSQPAPGFSQRQRLLWLQKRRSAGLWVQCDDCNKWRYMSNVLDSYELPKKWYCRLNLDKTVADCSVPEAPLRVRDEEDLIHGEYSAGSVVWARMAGWPWWPAMVDDCPDNEQYYWLDGFSDIPTHYNVVFFDTTDVTRAWIAPEQLKPYSSNRILFKRLLTNNNKYKNRIEAAMTQADDAERLPLHNRLAKHSFVARYKGKIGTPKKIDKRELRKIKNRLKRKFNIDFNEESSSDSDDCIVITKLPRNAIMVGSPRKIIKSKKVLNDTDEETRKDLLPDSTEQTVESARKEYKGPNSMSAQADSTAQQESEVGKALNTDDIVTCIPETKSYSESHDLTVRIASPSSDDFDF